MKLFDYAGIIHFHSSFSFDGHAELGKIIDAATKNNLDYLMLTDHDHLKAKDLGWEGWQKTVLLIVGQEISPRFNHYLGFNIPRPIEKLDDPQGSSPQKYIDAVNNSGGFGFIAHPDHEGTKTFHVKHYPWIDWSVDDYTGIGIWDFMTDWQNSLKNYIPALGSLIFPAFFLSGPRSITLARWDLLNQKKKIVGIGELDNHATLKKFLGFNIEIFPFDQAFKFIRTHICTKQPLTHDSKKDIPLLFNSLRHGCCYVAMEYFQSSRNFSFFMTQKNKEYFMGDSFTLAEATEMNIELPVPALISVMKNGVPIAEEFKKELTLPVTALGIYRVEAYNKAYGKYRPWIFSNNIYVN